MSQLSTLLKRLRDVKSTLSKVDLWRVKKVDWVKKSKYEQTVICRKVWVIMGKWKKGRRITGNYTSEL